MMAPGEGKITQKNFNLIAKRRPQILQKVGLSEHQQYVCKPIRGLQLATDEVT